MCTDFPGIAFMGSSRDPTTTCTDTDGRTGGWREVGIAMPVQDWLLNGVPDGGVRAPNSFNNASAPKSASADAPGKWNPANARRQSRPVSRRA